MTMAMTPDWRKIEKAIAVFLIILGVVMIGLFVQLVQIIQNTTKLAPEVGGSSSLLGLIFWRYHYLVLIGLGSLYSGVALWLNKAWGWRMAMGLLIFCAFAFISDWVMNLLLSTGLKDDSIKYMDYWVIALAITVWGVLLVGLSSAPFRFKYRLGMGSWYIAIVLGFWLLFHKFIGAFAIIPGWNFSIPF